MVKVRVTEKSIWPVRHKHKKKRRHERHSSVDMRYAFGKAGTRPFRALVVGKSDVGKTTWVADYLNTYGLHQFDRIICVAPCKSLYSLYDKLLPVWQENLHGIGGLDEDKIDELITEFHGEGLRTCIVFDDMTNLQNSQFVNELFTSGRHMNVSIFEVLHRIFLGAEARTQRCQAGVIVIFDFNTKNEAGMYFHQICRRRADRERLEDVYEHIVTRRPPNNHGCLIIDHDADSYPEQPLRCRDTKVTKVIPELWNL